ncbi:MAG: glycosyltransferase family 4 protein [Candidatus Riflebacteria bacterium]|nr:glycosyltransferase family 4 protein [Candidatus Riflebacteria bacterium]
MPGGPARSQASRRPGAEADSPSLGLPPGVRLAFLGNQDFTLWKFRGPWMQALARQGARVTVLSPPGPYVPRLRDLGLDVREFPLDRLGTSLLSEWRTCRHLGAILRDLDPDLLHAFMAKPVIYGCLAARWSPRTRVVATITGLGSIFIHDRFRTLQFLLRNLYRLSLRRASRVIFQNPDDQAFFRRHRIVADGRTTIIRGNGIPLPEPRQGTPRPAGAPTTVLMTARLIEAKGVREFCQAAAMLRDRLPGVALRFLLVGTLDAGSPDALADTELDALAARSGVDRLGHQEDTDALLAQADIFCLPSYREGLSVACLEAMAAGLPVVTTDAPGCRESVEPGVSGLLAPVGDAAGLAAALERLICDPDLRHRLGLAARLRCEREFSAARIFPQLAGEYRQVLIRGGTEA